ncbi:hypothetical protein EV121DRAFT_279660 [Schizophyllum commune]
MTTTQQTSTATRSARSCTPPFRKGWYVESGDSKEGLQGDLHCSEDASAPRSKRSAGSQRDLGDILVSTAVRRRVDDALRQSQVLPVEVTSPSSVVTLDCPDATTLYLEADTPSSVLDKLAWAWNKDREFLEVNVNMQMDDHPLNRVIGRYLRLDRADCNLNKYSGWLLCPDDSNLVLLVYIRYLDGNTPSSTASNLNVRCDPDELYRERSVVDFKYRLLPLPFMRQSGSDHKPAALASESDPPTIPVCLQDLPAIILLIPYHFVIYDTGRKLECVYGAPRPSMIRLAGVFHVYDAAIDDAREGQGGSGEPFDHGESGGKGALDNTSGALDGPYGLFDDKSSPSVDELELALSGTGDAGHSPPSPSPALRPTDSASCRDGAGGKEEGAGDIYACGNWEAQANTDEEAQECVKGDEKEDEEWEDPEYGEYLKAWAEDVWKASWEAPSQQAPPACT